MEHSFKKNIKKISSWLINNTQWHSNDTIKVLALIKLIQLIEGELNSEMTKFLHDLIKNNKTFNYYTDSLLNNLLANSILLEIGSTEQKECAKEYSSILFEIKNSIRDTSNSALLNYIFNEVNTDKIKSPNIEIPMFELDVVKMINNVLTQIEVRSKFGTYQIDNDTVFNSKIEGMTIHAIRMYDFGLSMRCLRALKILRMKKSLAVQIGLDFIRNQQCTDGSFGDFETAFSEMKNDEEIENNFIQIKLEIAIQVLWALYELIDDNNNLMAQLIVVRNNLNQKNIQRHVN
jgi:hypothetical protein